MVREVRERGVIRPRLLLRVKFPSPVGRDIGENSGSFCWFQNLKGAWKKGRTPHMKICKETLQGKWGVTCHQIDEGDRLESGRVLCCYTHFRYSSLGILKNFLERQDTENITFHTELWWCNVTAAPREGNNPGWTPETPHIHTRNFLELSLLSAQDTPGRCCQRKWDELPWGSPGAAEQLPRGEGPSRNFQQVAFPNHWQEPM